MAAFTTALYAGVLLIAKGRPTSGLEIRNGFRPLDYQARLLENFAEQPEQTRGQEDRCGQSQDPGKQQIAHSSELQAGAIRSHSTRNTG